MHNKTEATATRLLLIEDDDFVRKVHHKMLLNLSKDADLVIDIAVNGNDALNLITANQAYSLILTDVGLPDISGIELIATVRHLSDEKQKTPIIAITAYTKDIQEQCLVAGANAVYAKPVKIEILKEILGRYTGKK